MVLPGFLDSVWADNTLGHSHTMCDTLTNMNPGECMIQRKTCRAAKEVLQKASAVGPAYYGAHPMRLHQLYRTHKLLV